ncbi:hypothetical protein AcV5_000633 [Taiwanofungus camphoratus]|nr:hypothetical protein AcW2_006737 [Antrodia cinnamomea]KAI0939134.1 hypothetical protein AcV5_000633 [Antrodia cinnamomea]KAI0952052.1 hypothetical protein AcV7_007975 [Antrodia cinnamomea]
MPRLFPTLRRSPKENAYYEDYEPEYSHYDYGYDEQGYEREPRSAWRRVLSKKSRATDGGAYYRGDENLQRSRSYHATVEDYPEAHPGLHHTPSDDTESFVEIPSRPDSPVPIVQRESSLGRLQEAFADHGTYAPASEATTPMRGTPRYNPREMVTAGPIQMGTVHEARHQPLMVNSAPLDGIRPDVLQSSTRRRERSAYKVPYKERNPVQRPIYPNTPWEERHLVDDEYPPVVVVVQRGVYGEKDTYYIIPGGAPVIFEDEDGNEITRVGDFSGNYRPQRPRPVIVQDERGREICRAGFDDDTSSSRTRSDDSFYMDDGRSHRPSQPSRRRAHDSSHKSYTSSRPYDGDGHYPKLSYEHRESSRSPNIIFIDPSDRSSSSGRGSTDPETRYRSRPNHHSDPTYGSTSREHRYGSPSIIELEHRNHQRPSGSSRSGGSSSYHERYS